MKNYMMTLSLSLMFASACFAGTAGSKQQDPNKGKSISQTQKDAMQNAVQDHNDDLYVENRYMHGESLVCFGKKSDPYYYRCVSKEAMRAAVKQFPNLSKTQLVQKLTPETSGNQ